MTTRRRSTLAAVLVALVVALAPALAPAARAYDAADTARLGDSAQFILFDLEQIGDHLLIPRRAMEVPAQDGGNESMNNCNVIREELNGMRNAAFGLCAASGAVVGTVTVVVALLTGGSGALPAAAALGALCGGLGSAIAALEYRYNTYC